MLHRDCVQNCRTLEHIGTLLQASLDANTALLAAGHAVVCCFVNDDLSAEVVERLAEVGVK